MASGIDHTNFIDLLLNAVPELRPLYDAHMKFGGELLPHVFLADYVAPFILDTFVQSTDPARQDRAVLRAIVLRTCRSLEEILAASADESVDEAISLSFLACLYRSNDSLRFETLLGPNLLREWNANRGLG